MKVPLYLPEETRKKEIAPLSGKSISFYLFFVSIRRPALRFKTFSAYRFIVCQQSNIALNHTEQRSQQWGDCQHHKGKHKR